MDSVTIMLLVWRKEANDWDRAREFKLPALPRIGEHVVLDNYTDEIGAYRVVGVFHPAPNKGLIDVIAIYDGEPNDVQGRLVSS
jgi:hypothetical protein